LLNYLFQWQADHLDIIQSVFLASQIRRIVMGKLVSRVLRLTRHNVGHIGSGT